MLALHGNEDQFHVAGDAVQLGPQSVLAVSLLLHELATNAAKYGSLSAGGSVELDWHVRDGTFTLKWRQTGGPPATESATKGFGSKIIERGLSNAGGARTVYGPEGFAATFTTQVGSLAD